MSGGTWIKPKYQSVQPGAVTSTSTTSNIDMGLGDCYAIGLEVTAGGTGTSPTLDVVLQTSFDGGTTYQDLPLRFAQKTTSTNANAPEWLIFRLGLGENEVALGQTTADTGGSLAKNCLFKPDFIKAKYTIGGTSPTYTFTLHILTLPVQRRA